MCIQIVTGFFLEQREIDLFPAHLLNRAHAVHVFRECTVHRGARFSRAQKRLAGTRQPHGANEKQNRHDRQREHTEVGIQPQQHTHDTNEQDQVPDRKYRRFQKLLQRADITLQARHQPPHLGAVHKAQ